MSLAAMKEKFVAFKDKVLDFVDSVKGDPKKQAIVCFALGVCVGVMLRSL